MIVQVLHSEGSSLVHVADVYIPDRDFTSDLDACETAYGFTQNIMGSWSIGPEYEDGILNEDYNPAVTRVACLPVYAGKQYGLRSSMVGDVFNIAGRHYVCASFGFKSYEMEIA